MDGEAVKDAALRRVWRTATLVGRQRQLVSRMAAADRMYENATRLLHNLETALAAHEAYLMRHIR